MTNEKKYKLYTIWEKMPSAYLLIKIAGTIFSFFSSKVILHGAENIPKTGPLIIAANHVSYFDPILLSALFPRHILFIAKSELFKGLLGAILKAGGTFPIVQSSSDLSALRLSLDLLKKSKIIGIFPQGKRVSQGYVGEGAIGLALIAYRAKVPVMPVAIYYEKFGDYYPAFRGKIIVNLGKPIMAVDSGKGKKEQYDNFTKEVMSLIGNLLTV